MLPPLYKSDSIFFLVHLLNLFVEMYVEIIPNFVSTFA